MDLRFHIDPETGMPHIFRHGVEEYEVEDVLADYYTAEDRQGREGLRSAIGQTRSGRYLRVIYREDREAGRIIVVTAYDLRGNARQAYRRRKRRRGGR